MFVGLLTSLVSLSLPPSLSLSLYFLLLLKAPAIPSALPEEYLKNYALACKLYSTEPSDCIKKGLETEEGAPKNYMFIDEPVSKKY
jgi:hypothetical protein